MGCGIPKGSTLDYDKLSLSSKIFADNHDTNVFASTNNLPLKFLWTPNLKRWKNGVM